MTFGRAVEVGFDNYSTFAGRASRSAFWYWALFEVLAGIAATVADALLGTVGVVSLLTTLGLFLPGLAVSVRRLHDVNKTGWNYLWMFIPVLGWLYLLILFVQAGTPGPNQYGDHADQPAS